MSENILSFALCPNCFEKDISKLQKVIYSIACCLKKEIKLITFKNFSEEESALEQEEYHFFYTDPDSTLKLLDKGYFILGKFKNEQSALCSITSKQYFSEKDVINVALINKKYFLFPLLFHKKEFEKFHLIFADTHREVLHLVENGSADIGFIYSEKLNELKNYTNINFSEDFCFPIPHYILAHPSMKKFKDIILSIEDIEKSTDEEIENLRNLYKQLEQMLQNWAYHDIVNAFINSPNMGIIIYQEKVIYANNYAINLLGYTEEELYKMSSLDFVYHEDRKKVFENYKKRLRGKKFSQIYEIRYIKKQGSVIYVQCLTNTIFFKGIYSGLIVFYDITSKKHAENLREILKQSNKIIIESFTEEDIYHNICKALVENLGFKLAWVSLIDENKIIPKFHYGDLSGFFKAIDIQYDKKDIETLKTGQIVINPDIRTYSRDSFYITELIKKGLISSCTIPLSKSGKIVALLNIYSEFPDFFSESIVDSLKEIQKDLSFALEKVEKIRQDIMISEAIKNSDIWLLVTDENGNIVYVNESVEKISGYKKAELIGKNPRIFKSGLNPPEFYTEMWNNILSGKIFNAITPNRKKNGEIFHVDLKIIPIRLPGNILRFVAVASDITEKIVLSERIKTLQNYDALTGLLNLNGFATTVSLKLKEASSLILFILIDIYNMTYINKIHGISAGDELLRSFAQRLINIFGQTNIISRIGSDSFGICLTIDTDEIYNVYSKLYELNNTIVQIGTKSISFNINASISLFPKDGRSFTTLYERADITLSQAKKEGAGTIKFFDPEIEKETDKLWNVITIVKKAVDENLFVFHYQPYLYTNSLQIAGFEALMRIIDRDGTIYYPDFFIDYIENSQYLMMLENRTIQEAIEKIKEWKTNISINISGKTFNNANFIKKILDIPVEVRNKLTLEITERIFIEDPYFAIELISSIKKLTNPPKIAMDDFGTGYSSLAYLKDLPIDIIKIDIAFIRDMIKDRKSLAIVQTIIDLAKRLDKITLAEGVENKDQYEILKSIGCDMVQGFLFYKPMPKEKVKNISQ